MIRPAFLALLVIWASAACAGETWQRSWVVAKLICQTCSPASLKSLQSTVGTVITLDPDRFDNPLYESCPAGVDYSDMRTMSRQEAALTIRPGHLPAGPAQSVVAGTVRCAERGAPGNTIARFVFSGSVGYYLFEEGALLELH